MRNNIMSNAVERIGNRKVIIQKHSTYCCLAFTSSCYGSYTLSIKLQLNHNQIYVLHVLSYGNALQFQPFG